MSGGHQLRMGRFCWKTGEKRHSLSREACVTVGQLTDSPFEVCGNKFTVKAGSVVSLALPFPPGPRSHLGGNPRMWIVGINSDWPLLGEAEHNKGVVGFYKRIMTNCDSKPGKERREGVRELLRVKSGKVNWSKVEWESTNVVAWWRGTMRASELMSA